MNDDNVVRIAQLKVTVEVISEQLLIPALHGALAQFPFRILGFHSDNGSEYINKRVAELLQKRLIEQRNSRAWQSNTSRKKTAPQCSIPLEI